MGDYRGVPEPDGFEDAPSLLRAWRLGVDDTITALVPAANATIRQAHDTLIRVTGGCREAQSPDARP